MKKYVIIWWVILLTVVFWLLIVNQIKQEKLKQEAIKIEQENIKIDEYNFQQLEKIKPILDDLVLSWKKIPNSWIEKFNNKFSQKIQPKKNCYYIWTYNWSEKYIFWFKLESKKYITKYWTAYFAYPKYALPIDYICTWECYDYVFDDFMYTISNPCEK